MAADMRLLAAGTTECRQYSTGRLRRFTAISPQERSEAGDGLTPGTWWRSNAIVGGGRPDLRQKNQRSAGNRTGVTSTLQRRCGLQDLGADGIIFPGLWQDRVEQRQATIDDRSLLVVIERGCRGITVETALRLAQYFRTDAQSWMNLQQHDECACARRDTAEALRAIRPRDAT